MVVSRPRVIYEWTARLIEKTKTLYPCEVDRDINFVFTDPVAITFLRLTGHGKPHPTRLGLDVDEVDEKVLSAAAIMEYLAQVCMVGSAQDWKIEHMAESVRISELGPLRVVTMRTRRAWAEACRRAGDDAGAAEQLAMSGGSLA